MNMFFNIVVDNDKTFAPDSTDRPNARMSLMDGFHVPRWHRCQPNAGAAASAACGRPSGADCCAGGAPPRTLPSQLKTQ